MSTGKTKDGEVRQESSSDQIVRDVISGLYEGRYVAGQRLVEPDLIQRYAVSRGTVREAIKRLSAEGVVAVHAHRGAHIRHLSRSEARNILLILELIIGLAARQAAENIEKPGARRLFVDSCEALLDQEASFDSYDMVRSRNRFYRAMVEVAGNHELDRILRGAQVHLVRTHLKLSPKQRLADYRRIADAILAGNGAAAERVARAHVQHIAKCLDDMSDHTFAPETQPDLV